MARRKLVEPPPERYQTLGLTALFTLIYLPLIGPLGWQVSGFVGLIGGLRLFAVRWPAALPGPWVLGALALLGTLNCLHAHHSIAGKVGGTSLLVTMLALKLLELRSLRDDRMLIIGLSFLTGVQFLFNQGIGFTLFQAVAAFALVAFLVDLNGGLGAPRLARTLRVTRTLAVQAIPLTILFFLLFPRLDAPLWSLGVDRDRGISGVSDRLEPGSIIELVLSDDLAFRASFDGTPPSSDQLYWRGLVLWSVDDHGWSVGNRANDVGPGLMEADEALDYEVLLEASGRHWLFGLDLPVTPPPNARLSGDFRLTTDAPITSPTRFRLSSALRYRTTSGDATERRQGLQLPTNVTDRMRRLVKGWQDTARSDWDLVQAGLAFFSQEDFHYTLLPPKTLDNPWDQFLFETRSGFCEHYAGSFALLMRLAGIPARVVVGYLGGERNTVGGYHMIWQSDAHAWTEVLIADRGWVRVDPTAAIDPGRVDRRGASRLVRAGSPVRFHLDEEGYFARGLRRLRDLGDTLDATWKGWILDFSASQQRRWLEWLGLRQYGEYALVFIMMGAAGLVLGLILVSLLRRAEPPDPLRLDFDRLCRRLGAIGLPRRAGEGPLDYFRRVSGARPDLAADLEPIFRLYLVARYRGGLDSTAYRHLGLLIRRFRPSSDRAFSRRVNGRRQG